MRKQKLSTTPISITGASSWIREKGFGFIPNEVQANTQKIYFNFIYKPIYHAFKTIQKNLKKVLITNLNGQVVLTDEMVRTSSYLHPYNFLGTPQALFLLPNTYRYHAVSVSENNTNKELEHSDVKVQALGRNRFELVITGQPGKFRINIYNGSNHLVFSEQISHKGEYQQVYVLNPDKTASISFEVVSKNGVFRSRAL